MREFRRNGEGRFPVFLEYLDSLPKGKVVPCEYLRVLSEDTKLITPERPSKTYPAGTLMCLEGTRLDLHRTCGVSEAQIKLKEGKFTADCRMRVVELSLIVVGSKIIPPTGREKRGYRRT